MGQSRGVEGWDFQGEKQGNELFASEGKKGS